MNSYQKYSGIVRYIVTILFAAVILTACGAKTQIILLPDQSGKTGVLDVSDAKGGAAQTLDQPWQSTQTSMLTGAPGAPQVLDEKRVKEMLGQALTAEPLAPVHFLMYFDKNSTNPTRDSLSLLTDIMAAIKARNSMHIAVIGHSDSVGSALYNDKLSLQRARAVTDMLVSKGVDRRNIEISNHGKANPLIPTPDGVAEPRNRRVEITIR